MSATYYDIGDRPTLQFEFRDEDGNLADPSEVKIKQRVPDGTETEFVFGTDSEVQRFSEGRYRFRPYLNAAGRWAVRAIGTGLVEAAEETYLTVRESVFIDPL
jgi:hypothetical protein